MKRPALPELSLEPYSEPLDWEAASEAYSKGDIVKYQPQPSGWWRAVEWCRTRIFRKPHRDVPTYWYTVVDATGCWSTNLPPPDDPDGWTLMNEVNWDEESKSWKEVLDQDGNTKWFEDPDGNVYKSLFTRYPDSEHDDEIEQFTWESDSDGFREVVSLIDNNLPPQVSMTNYYLLRFARGEEVNQWALYEEIDRCCQSRLIEIGKIDHLKRTCIDLYSREKQA